MHSKTNVLDTMKNRIRLLLATLVMPIATGLFLTSCLEDKGYTDIVDEVNSSNTIVSFYGNGGTTGTQSVQLTAGKDTVDYELHISATSSHSIGKDVTVTVSIDESVIAQVNASIENADAKFTLLPDSVYDIVSNSVTIPDDTTEASLFIRIYQYKMDKIKSYLLPVKINDTEDIVVADNLGTAKLAFIGNPIAGAYLWDFYRYNNQDGSGSPTTTWTDDAVALSAVSPTSINVPTGYYVQPNYLITFDNNSGVLSNFKAVIDPDEIKAAFTDNGVTVVDGPTITVSEDYKTFTIKYTVFNGSAYRNLTDIYHK
jgi:hypothetical protein